MDRENVIAKLRAHERELKEAGVLRLSLFGSTARGDGGPGSDIDLLAAFGDPSRLSLLDVVHLENQMTDILGQQDGEMSYAVKYELLRISEATYRLEDLAEELCPGAPRRDIRGLGNHLRHAYDSIDSGLIWMIVEKDLAPLKAAAQAALQPFAKGNAAACDPSFNLYPSPKAYFVCRLTPVGLGRCPT